MNELVQMKTINNIQILLALTKISPY